MEEFELEPGETVTTEVRQHVFVLLLRLVPFALLAFLPLIILPVFSAIVSISQKSSTSFDLGSTGWFFLGIWWLFLWMGAFAVITRYFLTVWVITSHRIVDISQSAFFSRKVSSFLLVRVQDVTTDVSGVLGTLIGFGDINVETAGSAEKFAMCGIRHPEAVRDLIMREVAVLHADDDPKTGV
jgi:uncharacterized membrane protein YdbT with pleckstrin-like domain